MIGNKNRLEHKVGQSSDGREVVYLCPFCEEVNGTPDLVGKLYYNVEKRIGYCHRCSTPVFDTSIPTLDQSAKELMNALSVANDEEDLLEGQEYTLDGWTTSVSDNEDVQNYLLDRNITDEIVELYRLRATETPSRAVVIPNCNLGHLKTDFFQLRDISKDAYIKYRNPSGSKPVFGIDHPEIEKFEHAFLAEGVFSAMAAASYNPEHYLGLCTYGKTIVNHHVQILKELSLKSYTLIYDGGELGAIIKAANILLTTGKKVFITLLPYGHDPNSLDEIDLAESVERYTLRYQPLVAPYLFSFFNQGQSPPNKWESGWEYMRKQERQLRVKVNN